MKINQVIEGLKDPKDNPCWKGYKPVGTKKKGGRTVPNCVPKESVEEAAATGKITDLKPGQSATIQTAPGVSTTVDLKANPTALAKDETGKLKLVTNPAAGSQTGNEPELPKAGDEVEIGEDEVSPRFAGLQQTKHTDGSVSTNYSAGPMDITQKVDASGKPIHTKGKYDVGIGTLGAEQDHVTGIKTGTATPRGDFATQQDATDAANAMMPTSSIAAGRGVDPKKFAAFQKKNPAATESSDLISMLRIAGLR